MGFGPKTGFTVYCPTLQGNSPSLAQTVTLTISHSEVSTEMKRDRGTPNTPASQ